MLSVDTVYDNADSDVLTERSDTGEMLSVDTVYDNADSDVLTERQCAVN